MITGADIRKDVIIIRFEPGEHEFVEHKLKQIEGVSEPDARFRFLKLWNIGTTADWSVNSVVLTVVHNAEAGQPLEFNREVAELLFEGLKCITSPDIRKAINAKVAGVFTNAPTINLAPTSDSLGH